MTDSTINTTIDIPAGASPGIPPGTPTSGPSGTSGQAPTHFTRARLLLRAVHRATAYFILSFLLLHFSNHLTGLLGVDTYNAVQAALRPFYRNPVIEPLLIAAVVFQLILGLTLLVKSLRQERPKGFWSWLQIVSGLVILLTVSEHLIALYLARGVSGLDTTFYWPLSVMDGAPFTWYFAPYYFLLVAGIFAHAAAALHYIGRDRGYGRWTDRTAIGLLVAGAFVAALLVLMLGQAFYDVTLPGEWIDYLRQFVPDYGTAAVQLG